MSFVCDSGKRPPRRRENEEQDSSTKKQKTDVAGRGGSTKGEDGPTPPLGAELQVAEALSKIRSAVGNPAKFNKAAKLLSSLCRDGNIGHCHAALFLEVVACAMLDRDRCLAPERRKSYCRMISDAVDVADLFDEWQKKQLEVYQLWTTCRNGLFTDDPFVFGKNMTRLRELALQLPVATEVDEAAHIQWSDKMAKARELYQLQPREGEGKETEGDDIRNHLFWTSEECLAARREALVDWLEASKYVYRHQWACTAVDISINELNENKDRFCEGQRQRIEAMLRFSKDQKMLRQQGPSSKEKRRDANAFDHARKEWSKARVSNRGMVGADGDHQSEAWLG